MMLNPDFHFHPPIFIFSTTVVTQACKARTSNSYDSFLSHDGLFIHVGYKVGWMVKESLTLIRTKVGLSIVGLKVGRQIS